MSSVLSGTGDHYSTQNDHEYIIVMQKNEKLTKIAISVMTNPKICVIIHTVNKIFYGGQIMKKLTALLCITALLCGCTGKSNVKSDNSTVQSTTVSDVTDEGSSSAAPTEPAPTDPVLDSDPSEILVLGDSRDMTTVANVDWAKIYRAALEDFKKSDKYDDTARFTIYDMNDDKVPELIISYGPYGNKTYLIRSLCEGYYTEFDPITDCGMLNYIMDRSLITTTRYHDDIQVMNIQLYRLKGKALANVGSFQRSNSAVKEDGNFVTEEKYTEDYNHFLSGFVKNMGEDHSFDDDVIKAALGEYEYDEWKEAFAAVLNDYLKTKKANDDNHFSLMDINGDDIPELFISGAYHYAPYVNIFAWNGCPVPVGSFGNSDGTIGYDDKANELYSKEDNPNYTAECIYTFNENYKFSEVFTCANSENSKQQDANFEVTYVVNGEKTDKSSYEKAVKERLNDSLYVLGMDNDLTEETIKEFKEGNYIQPKKK